MHRSQNAVSTINMAITYHCPGSTIDTEDPAALWIELWDTNRVSAEATIHDLIPDCHLVWMQEDEWLAQYVDRIELLQKSLNVASRVITDEDKIRTMFRGVPTQYAMISDLFRDLGKRNHDSVAIPMAKEHSWNRPDLYWCEIDALKRLLISGIIANHPKDACYQWGKSGHYKRDLSDL